MLRRGALVLLALGCASPRPAPEPERPAERVPVPSAPAATQYVAPSPPAGRDQDLLRRALAEEVLAAAAKLRRKVPVRDARLDHAADDIAQATREGNLPSFELVAFLLSHYGLVEPEPSLVVLRGGAGAERSLLAHLEPQLPGILSQGGWSRLGIGIARRSRELVVVLALQEQHLELRPVRRELPAHGSTRLSGQLVDGFHQPQVLITTPRGGVRELPARVIGDRFESTVACADGPGVYQVEVTAEDERGPAVLANFPLFCGVDAPRVPPAFVDDPLTAQDPADAERELLELINRDRRAIGLGALKSDRRLAAIARAHSAEMAATLVVAHISPRTGSAADRVQRTGLRPSLVSENVGRAYYAAQAERGFMASPGHRANLIDPRITHVGVGVIAGRVEAGGAVPLFFTQLFVAGI